MAAIAGVSVSTVKRAVRAARLAGLVEVTIRRVSAFRNDTNVVVVVSADWKAWLSRRGGGVQRGAGTNTRVSEKVRSGAVRGRHRQASVKGAGSIDGIDRPRQLCRRYRLTSSKINKS